jgi:ATP-independent RNA helicase DbpA
LLQAVAVSANHTDTSFAALSLSPELLGNLESLGYTAMTPIQTQSLPFILAGRDVIGQAKTGSGKTAAFGLGLLNKLEYKKFQVQALVLCPTRELADQVANAIRELARAVPNVKVLTLCGGTPFGPQAGSLEHGTHIVVGTPGRVDDHLRKGTLKLAGVKTLVLDEADRMLDMGFQEELDAIVEALPANRQTLLFSATFAAEMEQVANRIMQSPERITVAADQEQSGIEQHFFITNDATARLRALRLLLLHYQPDSTVVFCTTRQATRELATALRECGFSALAILGDLEKNDRDRTLVRFANKSTAVLVATDVAARGLDIDALDAVVNYEVTSDPEIHVHRIGRTGRAGSTGMAFTLYADDERHKVERIAKYMSISITPEPLPPKELLDEEPPKPAMVTLQIDGGKKQKLRPGDILGALTGANGITGKQVGKINIFDNNAYVAIDINAVSAALKKLGTDKLKGRSFRARRVEGQPENSRRLARRQGRK